MTPQPALPPLPQEIIVVPVLEECTLYRSTFAADLLDTDRLLASLTSNAALKQKPRKIETVFAVLHSAVSTWVTAEGCWSMIDAYPKNGDRVAVLQIRPHEEGHGICVDRPGQGIEHRSVWGAATQLLPYVTDVRTR